MSQQRPRLSSDASSGAALLWPDGPSLRRISAAIRFRAEGLGRTLRILEPGGSVSAHGLRAVWHWQPVGTGYRVWVELDHEASSALHVDTVDILAAESLDLGVPPEAWSVYQNGWQSWSPTFARHLADGLYTDPGTPAYRATHQPHWEQQSDDAISSEWLTVLSGRPRQSPRPAVLLAGFVTVKDQLAELRVRADGTELTARCHFDGAVLPSGESVRSEILLVQAAPDALGLLEDWAQTTGREMEARIPDRSPAGWCTWYYYYGENTASDVRSNVEAIANRDLPLDVILLDDGYQTAIGDWFSLDVLKFPQRLGPVVEGIRERGHKVGIWTAPFGAAAGSRLFEEHPDWFLRDDAGDAVVGWNHWGVDCYALDCTHPEVQDWLGRAFGRMRADWGVEFFKIDFIFAAARPGRRHDATATRAQALRRGVEAIREAIGGDAFLLGCGAPLGPCVGLVDGMRVGPDVDPNWHPIWRHDLSMPSTENALRNAIARAPLHGRLWANDPDCLLVRQRGPDLDLVLNEMRSLVALVALLGGVTLDSDDLASIRPGRLKYLRQALPSTGISARPLDLFENEMPRLLLLPVERSWGRWWVVGVVNWDDRTTETTVRLAELGLPRDRYHVYHYWRRRYMGVTDDAVTIHRHQPHETAVLLFKPVSDQPDLLTTTFHVCQGAVEVAEVDRATSEAGGRPSELRLCVVLEKAGKQFGEVLFALPEEWLPVEARVDGIRRSMVRVAPGVVGLGLTLEGRAEVDAGFEWAGRP